MPMEQTGLEDPKSLVSLVSVTCVFIYEQRKKEIYFTLSSKQQIRDPLFMQMRYPGRARSAFMQMSINYKCLSVYSYANRQDQESLANLK